MRRQLGVLATATAVILGSTGAALPAAGSPRLATADTAHNHRNVPVRGDAFTLATFNVLGHSHTARGGNKRGYAGSATRMRYAVKAMRNHGVEVVGFQELEEQQKRSFRSHVERRWGIWSGSNKTRNSIAWRKGKFEFVSGDTIMIPYFHGTLRPMPVVLLRSKVTGQKMYFANFHNPANTSRPGNEEKWRDEATRKQIRLAHELRTRGRAVFVIGDMNEREEYFCKFTRNGDMRAANGGSNGATCRPPRPPNWSRIDWIFGSRGVDFSDYRAVESRMVNRATDHPLVVSRVH